MGETTNIPDNFLPPEPPPTASSRQIDFMQTNPPLRDYRRAFAAVIDDALTPSECAELIHLAEASTTGSKQNDPPTPTWERAMINIGNGEQMLAADTRNCGRIIYDTPDLAARILARIRPFLGEYGLDRLENKPRITGLRGRGQTYQLTRLNERLRFLKYEGGEYFRPHWDGLYATPDGKEMSFYTIHLYLNGDGEQDLAELKREEKRTANVRLLQSGDFNTDVHGKLLGGATSFIPRYEEPEKQVRVFPRTGSVLVFQQNEMLHAGDPVFRGTKFTVRTDIMYTKVDFSQGS